MYSRGVAVVGPVGKEPRPEDLGDVNVDGGCFGVLDVRVFGGTRGRWLWGEEDGGEAFDFED